VAAGELAMLDLASPGKSASDNLDLFQCVRTVDASAVDIIVLCMHNTDCHFRDNDQQYKT